MLRIASTAFGIEDPDYAPQIAGLAMEMMEYYRRLKEDRLANPSRGPLQRVGERHGRTASRSATWSWSRTS